MYAKDEPSSWERVPAAGDPATAAFATSEEHELTTVEVPGPQLRPEVAEQLDSGILMSFLTDFRSAEYEQVRKQREEELAKTRKRAPRRPVVPEPEEVEPEAYYEEAYETPEPEAAYEPQPQQQWAPPPAPQPDAYWPPSPAQDSGDTNGGEFLNAAYEASGQEDQRGRKLRFPFGVRQSPATT
jgi:hypothetical protein